MEPDVFRAVADPTRRAILDLLAEGELAVKDLQPAFRISQPGLSQHLRVLREAAVEEAVRGALVRYQLVLAARVGERLLEGRVVGGGDVLVGARREGEDRRREL